jgi:D-alanyl-D-alanine carboxypeptidase
VNLFIKEMNLLAKNIKMKMSNFANPHGLSNTSNYSTASDLCKLTAFSMKNP